MKKIFTLMTAVAIAMSASAQSFKKSPMGKLGKESSKITLNPTSQNDGDVTWGYFEGSSEDWEGLGTGSAATFGVAIYVPGDIFAGSKLKTIKVPVLTKSMTDVSAWVKTTLDGDDVANEAIAQSDLSAKKYAEVTLSDAYTIPESGVYVGYTFTSTESYPIPTAGADMPGGLFLEVNGQGFEDYSDGGFGVSPIQIVVGDLKLEDYNAFFSNLESKTTLVNSPFTAQVYLNNSSKNDVKSIDYTIEVDGKKEQKHLDLETPLSAGLGKRTVVEVEGTSASEAKVYTVTLSIDKVNGQPNADKSSTTAKFKNVSKAVARHTVVEEFTGTGCGWCPRGWVGMERLKRDYQDRFVGIAFHKYNTSDPMYVANYIQTKDLGITGAPSCSMDRKMTADPYYGASYYGIWSDFETFNEELPAVDVKAEAQWNENKTAVAITAEIEPLTSGLGFTVAYVLTADSLSGTDKAWKQTNYYYQYTAQEVNNSELSPFCKNGEKGQSAVSLVFNDVMIGSSYNTKGANQAAAIDGSDDAQLGKVYEGGYTVNMPTKETLKNAIDTKLVFANVLVVSNETGEILNAVRCAVREMGDADGIETVIVSDAEKANVIYNLAGQRVEKAQKGVYIVGGKKILVK